MTPAYSVVIPVHDEAESIVPLLRSLRDVMDALGRPYETIIVDDGSTDGTARALSDAPELPSPGVLIRLDGRQGKSAALQAGYDAARAPVLITLDGDGQNDPADIPELLAKLAEGFDVVCGWRHARQDPASKRWASRAANAIRRRLTGETVHDVGCALRVLRREALEKIYLTGGYQRMFVALAARYGSRIAEVRVRHHPRRFGVSKYGFWDRLIEGTADLFRVLRLDPSQPMPRAPSPRIKEVIRT
ncbi:MAG TPA: glycosyltransferase family 2 protein [Elusimicrobiota bacterium]|nr:glycosyltransferase family 2 protein [Elusimicrobiota bacterium]